MSSRPLRLPPLNALRVFHTVLRHRSFRAAADELHVTPQAVSQQIKLLEDALGIELFSRKGRAIEPNDQAVLFSHYVQSAFDELAEGVRRVTKIGPRTRIHLNASPYFATRYLMDRLAKFRALLPEIDLRLTTMVDLPDFIGDEVDAAIQWGYGQWKGLESRLLIHDHKQICCTPQLARSIQTPEDLLKQTLLHVDPARDLWGAVLAHLGLSGQRNAGEMRFHDAATIRRATLAGLGVGLLSSLDADEDLRLGKLVAPLGRDVMAAMPPEQIPGFYLVLPKAHRRIKAIDTFCNWVAQENWHELELPPLAPPL